MPHPSVKKNFLYNSAYQLLVAVAPLITTPYLSRTIGSVGNGVFTYTQSIANYFVMAAVLGMTNYGVRSIAECRDDRDMRSQVFWNAFSMNLVVGVVVCFLYVAYALCFGSQYLTLLVIWGMWLIGSVIDVTWLLWGMQEFRIPTLRNFATRLASIVFIFVFVHDEGDVWAYVAAISGAFLVNSLLVWPFVKEYVDWTKPTWRNMVTHLSPNLQLFVPVVATSLYLLLDKVMLGAIAGMGEVGLYDYAEKVAKMPMSVITALGAVMLPKMTTVIAGGNLEEGRALVKTTMWFMEACAIALCFGIIGVAPEFVPVFFGAGYDAVVPLMQLLAVIVPLICATNVIGVQYLLPSKRDSLYTLSVAFGAIVNVVVNVFAIPKAGALGASIATVAAEMSVLIFQARIVKDELPLSEYLRGTVPFIAIAVMMVILIRILAESYSIASHGFIGLLAEVTVGGLFYLSASLTWCIASHNLIFKAIFGKYFRRG